MRTVRTAVPSKPTFVTELPQEAATQTLSPSKVIAAGDVSGVPMLTVSMISPSMFNFRMEFTALLPTHIYSPSNASARG